MNDATPDDHAALAWGWAGSALEAESGDLHVVVTFPGGALVGLIDGLGHGPHAAEAARVAAAVLVAHASDSLAMLVQHCHEALRKTRGAVMSLASFRTADSSMTWLGVGNVDAVLIGSDGTRTEAIAGRGGVVGYQVPALRSNTVHVSPEATLIMVTDGIRGGFTADLAIASSPQEIADTILARFTKGSDDAHVIVARYLGGR